MDPFVLNEKDGYFYGRGTLDVKGGAAILVAAFAAWRQRRLRARSRFHPGAHRRRGRRQRTMASRGCSRIAAT